MSNHDVVVTGLGVVSPVGIGVEAFKAAGRAGRTGVGPYPDDEASHIPVRLAAPVRDFDPAAILDPKQARLAARVVQFGVHCAVQTTGSHDQATSPLGDVTNFGTIVGTAIGGLEVLTEQMEILRTKGPRRVSPFAVPQLMDNAAAAWIALRWGFRGPAYALSTSCATSMDAMALAYDLVRNGRLEGCLVGGSETPLMPFMFSTFDVAGMLSHNTAEPHLAARPFDAGRDGLVLAEGACTLLFERRDRAEKRGAKIYARVAGVGTASRPQKDLLRVAADGEGLRDAITQALEAAQVAPKDVGYVSSNGMGIRASDVAEYRALKAALGAHADEVPVGATKSQTGYTFAAAGAVSALAAVLAVDEGHLSPITSFRQADPECPVNAVRGEARQGPRVKYALANAMGFGGANSAVLFGAP